VKLTQVPRDVRLILGRTATVTIEQHDGDKNARPANATAAATPAATGMAQ
jgi:hypothetical protein